MKRLYVCIVTGIALCLAISVQAGDFGAYYTRLDFEDEISGKYADIVVRFDNQERLVFSRESSFLPRWETAQGRWYVQEIVPRKGDGTDLRPDKHNKYSYARIIQQSPEKIVVHWRYIPDFSNLNFDGVVHEIYTIKPDRKVRREIIRGRKKLAVFQDPENTAVQELRLESKGIDELSFKPADPEFNPKYKPVQGSPVIFPEINAQPAAWWQFDEGIDESQDWTLETVSGTRCEIGGNGALWKKGISGTALAFDGYFTKVVQPAKETPALSDGMTLEAWIVLGVYPYDWVALAHQCDWEEKGWFFGVDERGRLALMVSVKGKWHKLRSETRIPLNEWVHVAASFDPPTGKAALYVDGEQTDSGKLRKGAMTPSKGDLQIGLNAMKLPASGFPTIVGIEGLMDELQIHDKALDAYEIRNTYQSTRPGASLKNNPDLQSRRLPVPEGVQGFGAHYVPLKYHDLWDNMWRTTPWSDVAVTFDDLPTRVVFWRGPNYGPAFVTENNKWMIDQSVETGLEDYGCCEHMSDKQCRFSHIRIIENTPARSVVHWRYAFISTKDYLFTGECPSTNEWWEPYKSWIDEYYAIYPDGVTVRKIYNRCGASVSWQDIQFLIPAGETPDDQMHLQALTLGDIQLWGGVRFKKLDLTWEHGLPENTLEGANMEIVNMKSKYKPFLIFPEGIYIHPWVAGRKGFYSKFVSWNHWPAAQIPSDGRGSRFPDRLSHSALAAADNSMFHGNVVMYGFTHEPIESLQSLTLSWNYPPPVKRVQGAEFDGYKTEQRAYHMEATGGPIQFDFVGSEFMTIHNPCFVVHGWSQNETAKITLTGEELETTPEIKQGIVLDTDGEEKLVIWIRMQGEYPVHVAIRR